MLLIIWVSLKLILKYFNYFIAWFPHSATEEVLYIIKIVDTKINGTGNDVLHTFKSQMKPLNKSNDSMQVDGDTSMGKLF